jgi:hypothetical protein
MFAGHYSKLLASLLAATACCFFTAPESRAQQVVNGVQVFPPTSIFNTRIDNLPVDKNSSKYVKSLGSSVHFHPDWGTDPTYGIPYNVVTNSSNPLIDTPVIYYADESDLGPYPHVTTTNTQIEGYYWSDAQNSGDRHVLQVDITNGTLYEMWNTDFNGAQLTAGRFHISRRSRSTHISTASQLCGSLRPKSNCTCISIYRWPYLRLQWSYLAGSSLYERKSSLSSIWPAIPLEEEL